MPHFQPSTASSQPPAMASDLNRPAPGQYPPPPQWEQPRGAYPGPSHQGPLPPGYRGPPGPPPPGYGGPPPAPGDMAALPHPQHPGQHPEMYGPPPQAFGAYPSAPAYRGPPPPHGQMPYAPQQAPRQRTAIACRYCRRRKIRCSGYEADDNGRCSNCARFSQDCIFTPVQSQSQAFVPAHALYGRTGRGGGAGGGPRPYPQHGPPPTIYGAHGQPLGPPMGPEQGYPPPPAGYAPYPPPGPAYDGNGPPPPNGAPQDRVYQGVPYLPNGQPSYYPPAAGSAGPPPPPPSAANGAPSAPPSGHRSSPTHSQAYSYDSRASGSPKGGHVMSPKENPPLTPGHSNVTKGGTNGNSSGTQRGSKAKGDAGSNGSGAAAAAGASNGTSAIGGSMAFRDILGPGQTHDTAGGRSSADSSMLNALNKKM